MDLNSLLGSPYALIAVVVLFLFKDKLGGLADILKNLFHKPAPAPAPVVPNQPAPVKPDAPLLDGLAELLKLLRNVLPVLIRQQSVDGNEVVKPQIFESAAGQHLLVLKPDGTYEVQDLPPFAEPVS